MKPAFAFLAAFFSTLAGNKSGAPQPLARFHRARLYRRVQVAVARELGVSEGHVSFVARGIRRSARVEAALAEAVARLERQAA